MDNQIRMGGFNILPPGVKNLLIINTLAFVATIVLQKSCDLTQWLGLHFIAASDFYPWQFITYMFMHGNFSHLFFNMFALWMFGAAVENYWGTKRFLIYYFITGIGAALTHYVVLYFEIHPQLVLLDGFLNDPSLETYRNLVLNNKDARFTQMLTTNLTYLQQNPDALNRIIEITGNARETFLNSFNIIGASGAVYGILLAFGMLFPNNYIYIYFLLPIKAKWMVLLYGVLELLTGLGASDGVAHFAHLGGMVFGLAVILLWRRNERKHNGWTEPNRSRRFSFKRRRKRNAPCDYYINDSRPMSDEEYNARRASEQQRTDEILDKISKGGYESLSKEEKDFLFKQSRK